MNNEWLFLAATLLAWLGWALVALTAYRLVTRILFPVGPSGTFAQLLPTAAAGGLCLIVGYAFSGNTGTPVHGLRLPVVWLVMPFTGWASLFCLGYSIQRLYVATIERAAKSEVAVGRARQLAVSAAGWLVGAVAMFALLKLNGDLETITVIKGAIELSSTVAVGLIALFLAAFLAMGAAARATKSRSVGKAVASHILLILGSVIFGIPFLWALITSFKEDRDMSSPTGLVWIPRVQQTVPYRDPEDPLYALKVDSLSAEGSILQRLPDGTVKVELQRPMSLLGQTRVVQPSALTEIDKQIPLVTGKFKKVLIEGEVIHELEDGRREVKILNPPSLAGQKFDANPTDVDPVRKVGLRWQNYPEALEYLPTETDFGLVYLKNTIALVLLSVLGTVLSSSLVAYGFSRLKFPGRKLAFGVLLSTMMLPAAVTLMPTFLIFKSMGWIDTLLPIWVPTFFAGAFNVFLLRQFFMTIPMELEDASKIDGCSYLRSYWTVMLPQVKPALAVITVLTFVGVWNNFMGPLIYLNSPEKMTISYALQLYQGDRFGEPGLLMAFATMGMLPVILLFFFAQRYFIEGVTLSGFGGR